VTRRDIENEADVVSKVCQVGRSCQNVVEMYEHGWLDKTKSLYFIDMEYCSETLKARISGAPKHTKHHDMERDSTQEFLEQNTKDIFPSSNFRLLVHRTPEEGNSIQFDFESVAKIVEDIVSGLAYLHKHETVHRGLKPGNGT